MRPLSRHTTPFSLLLLFAALLLASGGALAAEEVTDPAGTPAPAMTHQMRAHIDPETGGLVLRPMPLQLSETLQRALSRSDQGLVPVTLADGTQLLDLQGRFMTLSVVRHDPKGGVALTCTTDAATVQKVLTAAPNPNQPADR